MTDREIDALVAEKIMGNIVTIEANPLMGRIESAFCMWFGELPHYSTDIAATWEVVEKMRKPFTLSIINEGSGFWECEIYTKGNPHMVETEIGNGKAETAPMAICLAALRAVGAEVPA